MRGWVSRVALGFAILIALVAIALAAIRLRYGGGELFPDRTTAPAFSFDAVEKVADLEYPPGNIAVSEDGRVFFSFHPEAFPPVQVAELVNGKPVPYPNAEMQGSDGPENHFQTVLSLRIDRHQRLWILDYANHGVGQPRLQAFDLKTSELVHRFDFPKEIAPLGSHLNDFQVHPGGQMIYIADASVMGKNPALIVYDVKAQSARRLLEGDPSVTAQNYVPVVEGHKMMIFGIFAVRPGVDSIALSRVDAGWLYYAPVTNQHMYRIRRKDLDDTELTPYALASRVQIYANKTMSDGITTDMRDNIYISDLEHSAIVSLGPDQKLRTLLKDPRLRWPDGLGFGPDGWLYFTCSALHHVIMRTPAHVRSQAPYQIYRFQPGTLGLPGH